MDNHWIADWEPSTRYPHYTRANGGEVAPDPVSPLCWTFGWEGAIIQGWFDGYCATGFIVPDDLAGHALPPICASFGGYLYINLSFTRLQAVRNPGLTVEQLDLAFFGDHPDVPPYVPHPDDERPDTGEQVQAFLAWVMSDTGWPELDADAEAVRALRRNRPDLTTLSPAELVARAREAQPHMETAWLRHAHSTVATTVAPGIFATIGQAIGDPTIPMRLLAAIGSVVSAEPPLLLWDLSRIVRGSALLTKEFDAGVDGLLGRLRASGDPDAQRFTKDFDDFLYRFGCRGGNEFDFIAEAWETKPELALVAVDRIRLQGDDESPMERSKEFAQERDRLVTDVRSQLADQPELLGAFEAGVNAGRCMRYREMTKHYAVAAGHEARMAFRELGSRAAASGAIADPAHIFMLLANEVDAFADDPAPFGALLAQRALAYRELFDLEPPFIIADGKVPALPDWPRRSGATQEAATPGTVLVGMSGSPGVATGRARIVRDPADPGDLEPGDILIAASTDPSWTPLFMAVSAAVVEVGGQVSHAIIVSRELGLPCVISVAGATQLIPDGAMVTVDGANGTVTLA